MLIRISGLEKMNLSGRFLLAAFVVIGIATVVFGERITKHIENEVLSKTMISRASFIETEIEQGARNLLDSPNATNAVQHPFDMAVRDFVTKSNLVGVSIWDTKGNVVYSTEEGLVGKKFSVNDNLEEALKGKITTSHDKFDATDIALSANAGQQYYDVYLPILGAASAEVLGIAEFYVDAEKFRPDLKTTRYYSRLEGGVFAFTIVFVLFFIVRQGSKTIAQQRANLGQKLREQQQLVNQNSELQMKLDEAYRQSVKHTEQFLQRISADLHDGPAQDLSFALLRLDELFGRSSRFGKATQGTIEKLLATLRTPLEGALQNIRELSAGVALPELEYLSTEETILSAVRAHEAKTLSNVDVKMGTLPDRLSHAGKICLYRFIQEGLNNAFRHAIGQGQRVEARHESGGLEAFVTDNGPGFASAPKGNSGPHLGLQGLKHRAEALGGVFEVVSSDKTGTRLRLYLALDSHDK